MIPVGRNGEETRLCPGLYVGLLSSSEECAGLWIVVALAGVNNSGNTLSNCLEYLIVAASIAPISESFRAAPPLLSSSIILSKFFVFFLLKQCLEVTLNFVMICFF